MKFKKKFLSVLLMLTCVFALTACGSDDAEYSELQTQKIQQAQTVADSMIKTLESIAESDESVQFILEYSNVELAAMFEQQLGIKCEGKAVKSGINSFSEGLTSLDGFAQLGEPEVKLDGDKIIINIPVLGNNMKTGSVEVIVSNDIFFNVSACTFNADESFGSLMGRAGLNTLIGMGTVFIVLILISFIISLFGLIPKLQEKKKANKVATPTVPVVPVEVAPVEEELADDTELVAVIAAAIAAYEGTSADGFQVRSIKRANTKKWQKA